MPPDFSFVNQIGMPAFVLRPDIDGKLVYAACNTLWLTRTQLTLDDVCGKTAAEVLGSPVGAQSHEEHLLAAQTAQPHSFQMAAQNGSEKNPVTVNLNPVFDEAGHLSHLVGVWIDMPSTAATATIEALMPEMEAFVSFAAHDLRTPMLQVHSLAELLREDFEDLGDGKLQLIDMLEDVAVKASSLVTDILAQTQASTATVDHSRFDLAQVWDDIMAVIDPRAQHVLTAPDLSLLTDRIAVQIGLRNLVDNAIKHGGKAQTTIRLEVSEAKPGELLFEVFDNGRGFPDPTIAFLEGGELRVESGYGLIGIKRLILSRGGTIGAENLEDAEGSVVRFTLPGQIEAVQRDRVAANF